MNEIKTVIFEGVLLRPFKLLSVVEYPPFVKGGFLHKHSFFQVVTCLDGEIEFFSELSDWVSAGSGGTFVIPPGLDHDWRISARGCRAVQLIVDDVDPADFGDLATLFVDNGRLLRVAAPPSATRAAAAALEKLFSGSPKGGSALVLARLLELLALYLDGAPSPDSKSDRDALIVGRAKKFMRNNCGRDISLTELAAAVGLGVTRFSQIFKAATGLSPLNYANRLRMEKAEALLLYSDLSVTRIAETLGYASIHYFSRAFKKHSGVSPSDFRGKR